MIERAKLSHPGVHVAAALSFLLVACDARGPGATYEPATRRLVRLDTDTNRDGAIDHRVYMDGSRPLRSESDRDGDGRVDRWEYFDDAARLQLVGGSSADDGIEDTWTWGADADGERRVDQSLLRDRGIDRREFFRDATLMRAEADTNADGRSDRWEVFEAGNLVQVAIDTTFTAGRPNRRLIYGRQGQFQSIELDADGDGNWEPVK